MAKVATASFVLFLVVAAAAAASFYSILLPFKSPKIPISRISNYASKTSCNDLQTPLGKFTRKYLLLGLFDDLFGPDTKGHCAGADRVVDPDSKPAEPDFWKCNQTSFKSGRIEPTNCCPPPGASRDVINFKLPPQANTLRVRRPFHLLDDEYVAKYRKGIEIMKSLPDDDPRSLKNQAGVHCSYCDGRFPQVGFPDFMHQIHHSWLFFPFHRAYIYFFEKIMGDLIGDPTFALPFWNWDTPAGMSIPSAFTADSRSPLYNRFRDARHLPPALIDLAYDLWHPAQNPVRSHDEQVGINLPLMYKSMVSGAKTATLFMGNPYVAGQKGETGGGLVETIQHDLVHSWVGNLAQEDMGLYYSAGRDPLFYLHHSNLDRMWSLWKTQRPGGGGIDFTDTVWLDTPFLFYNEKKELIRIKIRDILDTEKLGYRYEDVALPWLVKPPNSRSTNKSRDAKRIRKFGEMENDDDTNVKWVKDVFPGPLDKVIRVRVARPKKNRRVEEKEAEEEVLVIEGIEVNSDVFVKFDVLINYEDDDDLHLHSHKMYQNQTEYAGSFVRLRMAMKHDQLVKTSQRLGISELLEDLGADGDDHVQVTLVPRSDLGSVFIGGIKIVLESRS